MQKGFSNKADIALINLVKQHLLLYVCNDPGFKESSAREAAWQKIADEIDKPAADCKARWINIRDAHRRLVKRNVDKSLRPKREYKYDKELEFMRSHYKDITASSLRNNCGNDAEDSEKIIKKCQKKEEPDSFKDLVNEDSEKVNEKLQTKEESDSSTDSVVLENNNNARSMKTGVSNKKIKTGLNPETSSNITEEEVNTPARYNTPEESTISESPLSSTDSVASELVNELVKNIGEKLKTLLPAKLNRVKTKIFKVIQQVDLLQIKDKLPGELNIPTQVCKCCPCKTSREQNEDYVMHRAYTDFTCEIRWQNVLTEYSHCLLFIIIIVQILLMSN